MQSYFLKILIMVIFSFLISNATLAQSCNSLKELFENSDYCDNKKVSVGGTISEILDPTTLVGSKYIFGFWMIDENKNKMRVMSNDEMVLIDGNVVIVDGRYYKNLYSNGLNFSDAIVASGENIQVVLTAEELFSDILEPYGESLDKGKKLATWNMALIAIIPAFSMMAFYLGIALYKRRQIKGISFEGYVESLFSRQEWRLAESNAYRKHHRWIESNSNPDFVFIHRKTNKKVAVECKYKSALPKEYDRIFWAYEDQIEHYQNFSAKEKIPVFVIIGIGGRPKNPKNIFLISLGLIKYPDVKLEYLQKFERDPKRYFSLDKNNNLI